MTLTCESYHEDVHSVDRTHDSGPLSGSNLLKISYNGLNDPML